MAQRPSLSNSSFLAAVFAPKNNPVPTGLRKRKLVGKKWKASRLSSYNAMSALNQRVLDEAGQREAYLRGDVNLAEAKRSLRSRAVNLGIVKPLRGTSREPVYIRTATDKDRALDNLFTQLTRTKTRQPVNIGVLRRGTLLMSKDQLRRAMVMTAPQIKAAARNADEAVEVENVSLNPFWYH